MGRARTLTRARRKKTSLKEAIKAAEKTINDKVQLLYIENRALLIEKQYNELKNRLVSLLLPEQIEAAKICGITPELYALEWIDLVVAERLRKYTPAYSDGITGKLERS